MAPLPYAVADMAMADQGQMKCQNADQHTMHGEQATNDMANQQESCDCCEKCGSACSSCLHFSAGLSPLVTIQEQPFYDSYSRFISETVVGMDHLTEFRPPRKLHA